ncbi:MAG: hypothetical protein PHG54_13915 [Smithellaceae bacterium]|nr:hypothetical protein [Smithellaceae bacterium]
MIVDALLSAFPTAASFYDFRDNDREISRRAIPGIVRYAYNHSVIETPTEAAFAAFLKKQDDRRETKTPAGLTFPDVLLTLAGPLSVNALIAQLEVTARELCLPSVGASMITRLKKRFVVNTPKKRALLRLLAFKLGQKRPELNWRYDVLVQLPAGSADSTQIPQETSGVTITFHLQGEGAVIVPADVAWLKKELSLCIDYLCLGNLIHKKTLETIGATSFNLRAPKKPGPADEPRLYNEAVRNLMAIAHQMSARWLLSDQGDPRKKLLIIIHAGPLEEAPAAIQRIVGFRISNESGIYLTDFAHLCALSASVKAGFALYAPNAYRATGAGSNIWLVTHFLSLRYYDLIPCLFDEKMLPRCVSDPSYEDFRRALHFPEQAGACSFGAIAAMHRFPQSALLLTEIARALFARQMPFEADAVLANLLLSHPLNLTARLLRMQIYASIAHGQADAETAAIGFARARAQGDFIVGHCEPESDIWHEIGVLHFGQAVKYLQFTCRKQTAGRRQIGLADILALLDQAQDAFVRSMSVSAGGKALNSLYMFGYTLCLLDLLAGEDGRRKNSVDVGGIFNRVSNRVFRNIGWLADSSARSGGTQNKSLQDLLATITLFIARYENLVMCRSNIPHMYYMFALILWDFAPARTPQLCRGILSWLGCAQNAAEKLTADNLSVYSVVCGNIGVEAFLANVQNAADQVRLCLPPECSSAADAACGKSGRTGKSRRSSLLLADLDRTYPNPIIARLRRS